METEGQRWPTAPVAGTGGGEGEWDAALDPDCLNLTWLRVPLPLLASVEGPRPPAVATSDGLLRELVLDYRRAEA